jgi:electron-transferring-flavoprotein dehydrogenase
MDKHEAIETDVLIVGGGPAGLSAAIWLADTFRRKGVSRRIILIDKGNRIGAHILSGAVIDPEVFRTLLDADAYSRLPFDVPVKGAGRVMKLSETGAVTLPFHPPYLSNAGLQIASLGQLCSYLADVAESRGVEIYPGFAAAEMVYTEEGQLAGVKTGDTGIDRDGLPQANFQRGTIVRAAITILAEGSRGSLTEQAIQRFHLQGKHPQIYSLGIKELWSVPEGAIQPGEVYHTFGYPLQDAQEFGGGFVYGLSGNRVALGLVVGLDYPDPSFDPHAAMQAWKTHPRIAPFVRGGTLLEAGAKTLPEGGWLSLPRYYADNLLIVGDGAGFLSTPRLKGVHLAVQSGMCAAETAAWALLRGDTSASSLSRYETLINDSRIRTELYPVRNMRAVMQDGMVRGGIKVGIQMLTGGACLRVPEVVPDGETTQTVADFEGLRFAQRLGDRPEDDGIMVDKVTGVYRSGTQHEEQQPTHILLDDPEAFQRTNIDEYGLAEAALCPADVYEKHVTAEGRSVLRLHPENCLHCKTCDIKSPGRAITWIPPYGGDGPQYTAM